MQAGLDQMKAPSASDVKTISSILDGHICRHCNSGLEVEMSGITKPRSTAVRRLCSRQIRIHHSRFSSFYSGTKPTAIVPQKDRNTDEIDITKIILYQFCHILALSRPHLGYSFCVDNVIGFSHVNRIQDINTIFEEAVSN